jgi:hypothetical protein
VAGRTAAGEETGLRVNQTLAQNATGTLVTQELAVLAVSYARIH